jgi:hypothetical protein
VTPTARLLSPEVQILAIAVLLVFSGWVVWLIRTERLHLRESLIWLVTTAGAIAIAAWPELLASGARALGVRVPANALFGAGILYLAVNVLSVTIAVSGNSMKVRRLAQECALLRAEIETLRVGAKRPPPRNDAEGPPIDR